MGKILDQIFFCDPVVLELICYRTRGKRLTNESNTTGGLRKIWTGIQIETADTPRYGEGAKIAVDPGVDFFNTDIAMFLTHF